MNKDDRNLMYCEDFGREFKYARTYYIYEERFEVKEFKCGCPTIQLKTVKVFKKDELAPWESIIKNK